MSISFTEYLDRGTSRILELFNSAAVSTAERNAIASTFATELANHIGNTDGLSDSDLLIYTTSIQFIDGAISSILSKKKASYTDYESGIQLCTRQKQLLRLFGQKGWAVPALQNPLPDNCAELLRKRQESTSITEKILDESKRIGVLLVQARKEFSTSICDQAISLINELDQDLAICKQKRIAIPPIDFDPQRTKKELSELRIAAEKKETTEKELYNNHVKIRAIVSSRTTDVEQWRSVVTLSKRQSELIEECKRNKWPISTAQYGKPELIAKQYQHYLYMMETDATITREMGSLSSNKQYKQFFEHCALQESNISLCVQNGWWIPQLTNQEPSNLSNAFHAKKNKKDKRRRVKRWMLLFTLIIIALAALVLYGINKYRSGKVVIPFSASYAVGQDLDSVYSQLHEAGFQNITKKSDNSGWYKDNEVRSVTIDNSEKYSQGSYRTPDVSIVITYSSSNRVYVTDLLKGWKTKEYSVVENLLRDAGFTNIILKPVTTTDKGKENSTAELSLNGLNYTNEYCYLPISAPVIISYYTLQIGIGNDSSEFIGQNYENVANALQESGFTNIQTQEVTTGWAKENTVVGVTVNNVDTYSSGDLFAPDVKIVVKYSSGNRVDVSDIVKKWQTVDYEELVRALKSKGFSTIKVVEKTTETKTQNRLVSSISFDNAEYIAGECYLQKTASIRIEYLSLRIKISHTAKDFENTDSYSTVVSKLKNMGFTNIRLQRANDLVTGWVSKEGTIKTITINGRNDFSSTDSFKYDAEIIIVVHTFRNKGCEDITEIAD